jgi:hypothetical protein
MTSSYAPSPQVAGDGWETNPTAPVRSHAARRWVLLAVLVATAAGAAHRETLGNWASAFLRAYLDAQQAMLEATGNTNAAGQSEFAVLLHDGASANSLREAIAGIEDVSFAREADLDGWVIIETTAGNRDGLERVMALPEARLVVPNRGLWICH